MPARPRRTEPPMSANPSVISRLLLRTEARPSAALDEAALVARLAAGDRERGARGSLRPLRAAPLRARPAPPARLRARGGPRAGDVRALVALGGPLRPTALVGANVRLHARDDAPPSICGGGASRETATAADGLDPEDSVSGAAFDEVVLRLDVGEALDALTPGPPRGARAPVPRRPHANPGRRAARHPARHGQDAHAVRAACALHGAEGARSH